MTHAHPPVLVVDGGYGSWRAQALRALGAGWRPEALTWVERGPASAAGMDANAQMMLALPAGAPQATGATAAGDGRAGMAATPGDAPANPPSTLGNAPASASCAPPPAVPTSPRVRVSKELSTLLQDAAQYRAPERWSFLYRVLWRWCQGDRAVASAADEDGARLHGMAKAVRRARHDMIAYVRFHRRDDGDLPPAAMHAPAAATTAAGFPEFLAWYEPDHDVLPYAAEHFARRMGPSSWWIVTPHGTALWDGKELQYSYAPVDASAFRAGTGADQVESLWLAYYRNIFNPARLNEAALQQHMPVRFWKGLPEGPLIPAMIAKARNGARRVGQAQAVGMMPGKAVAMDARQALPARPAPSSLDQCRRCDLWRHATQAVPGMGPDNARIMLIGEQPGDHEDLAGRAFVGPAGQILDDALRRAGLPRETVFLTNAVKHFKWVARGKRRLHQTPGQQEVEACAHWLEAELARVRPAVIVTLGATALGAVLGHKANMRDYLDRPVRLGEAWLVATWHPSYALRVDDSETRVGVIGQISAALARARELSAS